jgi:predicted RNase H-like HicB family nuclease
MRISKYAVVIEKSKNGYGGYFPDVPGCIAVGSTLKELRENLKGALEMHFEGMREDGEEIPKPTAKIGYVQVKRET